MFGLRDEEDVLEFAEWVREAKHLTRNLDDGQTLYKVYYNRRGEPDRGGRAAAVVIDHPHDLMNGGTVMRVDDGDHYLKTLEKK